MADTKKPPHGRGGMTIDERGTQRVLSYFRQQPRRRTHGLVAPRVAMTKRCGSHSATTSKMKLSA